jgi:hypothetical protein
MTFVTAAMVRMAHRVIDTSGAPRLDQHRTYPLWGYFRNRLVSGLLHAAVQGVVNAVIASITGDTIGDVSGRRRARGPRARPGWHGRGARGRGGSRSYAVTRVRITW